MSEPAPHQIKVTLYSFVFKTRERGHMSNRMTGGRMPQNEEEPTNTEKMRERYYVRAPESIGVLSTTGA